MHDILQMIGIFVLHFDAKIVCIIIIQGLTTTCNLLPNTSRAKLNFLTNLR